MQNKIQELHARNRVLEEENAALSEKAEDTLLFGLVAETIYQQNDASEMIDQVLEKISILKNIPVCICLKQTPEGMIVDGFYDAFAEVQRSEIFIQFLEPGSNFPFIEDKIILDEAEFNAFGYSFQIKNQSFRFSNAMILSSHSKNISTRYYMFFDSDNSINRFPKLVTLFKQILQLATERLENIYILSELNHLNQELDQRVIERTEKYTETNLQLKREIQERKAIEKALVKNEKHLRSIYEAAIDVSFITVDLSDEFVIRSYSPGSQRIFGYSPDEIIGKPLRFFRLPNQTNLLHTIRRDFEEIGWSRKEEILLRRKSGKYFSAMLTVYPLYDDDSKLTGGLAVCIDISELKQTQNNLDRARILAEQNEHKFRTLFEQASDGIFISDINGNYVEVNENACKMLGYTKAELLRLNMKDIILPDDYQLNPVKLKELMSGAITVTERILVRKDGSQIPVEISGKLGSDGRLQGIVRDITDRKEFENNLISAKEKAEESDRLKTAFLQNISHEIRTPMNAILGFTDLLPEFFDDQEKLTKFAGIIRQRGTELLVIIEDILQIARIESKELKVNSAPIKMDLFCAEIESILLNYKRQLGTNEVKFVLNVDKNLKKLEVAFDQPKLKQILLNLVNNAFKFTSAGKVEVGCLLENQNEFKFYVSDTGIGIPKEKHIEIFSRFMQISQDPTKLYGGTGLGLAIVTGLLDLMGGKIWLESEKGVGSTFYFTIPVTINNQQVVGENYGENCDDGDWNNTGRNILIVEDDEYNSIYLEDIISDTDYQSFNVNTGKQAIELCSQQTIDLILMGMRVPDMNWSDLILKLRTQNPQLKIIVQTTYSTPNNKSKAIAAGCDEFLTRPVRSEFLLSRIDFHLKSIQNKVKS